MQRKVTLAARGTNSGNDAGGVDKHDARFVQRNRWSADTYGSADLLGRSHATPNNGQRDKCDELEQQASSCVQTGTIRSTFLVHVSQSE
ncbi:MAG: hypothetical protein V4529_13660 [Gemmatimonadota bacterium]